MGQVLLLQDFFSFGAGFLVRLLGRMTRETRGKVEGSKAKFIE